MALSSRTGKPHYLGHRRRIKNRFAASGLDAFSDYEVLELLLTFAIMQKDVKPIAKDMVHRFSSFQGVLDAPVSELIKIKGISEHAALLIKLVKACSDYYLRKKIISRKDIIVHSIKPLSLRVFRPGMDQRIWMLSRSPSSKHWGSAVNGILQLCAWQFWHWRKKLA